MRGSSRPGRVAPWVAASLVIAWGCTESPTRPGGSNQLVAHAARADFAAEQGTVQRLAGLQGSPVTAVAGDEATGNTMECVAEAQSGAAPLFDWRTREDGRGPYYGIDAGLVRFPAGESCAATLEGVFPDPLADTADLANYHFDDLVRRVQAIQESASRPLFVAAYDIGVDRCNSVAGHQGLVTPVQDAWRWSEAVIQTLQHLNNKRHDALCPEGGGTCCPYDPFCDLPRSECPSASAARDVDRAEICHAGSTAAISIDAEACTSDTDCDSGRCCGSAEAASRGCTPARCYWPDGRCFAGETDIVPVPQNCESDVDCGAWGRCCTAERLGSGACSAAQQGPTGQPLCYCAASADCGSSTHRCCTDAALASGLCLRVDRCYCTDDANCAGGGCCDADAVAAGLCRQNQVGACYVIPPPPTCPAGASCVGADRDDEEKHCATDFVYDRCPADTRFQVCQVEVLDEPFVRGGYGRDEIDELLWLYDTFASTLKTAFPDGKWEGTCTCGVDIIGPAILVEATTDTLTDTDLDNLPGMRSAREFIAAVAERRVGPHINAVRPSDPSVHCRPSCAHKELSDNQIDQLLARFRLPDERFTPDPSVVSCQDSNDCRQSGNLVSRLFKCCTAGQLAAGGCTAEELGRCVLHCQDDDDCHMVDDPTSLHFRCCTAERDAAGTCAGDAALSECYPECQADADCQSGSDPLSAVFRCCTAALKASGGCGAAERGHCFSDCQSDENCRHSSEPASDMLVCCDAARALNGECVNADLGRCYLPDHCTFLSAFSFHARVRFPLQVRQIAERLRAWLDEAGLQDVPLWLTNLSFELPGAAVPEAIRTALESNPFLYSAWYGASLAAARSLLQGLVEEIVAERGSRAYRNPAQPNAAETLDSPIFDLVGNLNDDGFELPAAYAWMPFRLIPAEATRVALTLGEGTDPNGFSALVAKHLQDDGHWKLYALFANANIHLGQPSASVQLTIGGLPDGVDSFSWRGAYVRDDTRKFAYSSSGVAAVTNGELFVPLTMSVPGILYVEMEER